MCILRPSVWILNLIQAKPNARSWSAHRSQAIRVELTNKGNPTSSWLWIKLETPFQVPLEQNGVFPPVMKWNIGWLAVAIISCLRTAFGAPLDLFSSDAYFTQWTSLDFQSSRKILSWGLSDKKHYLLCIYTNYQPSSWTNAHESQLSFCPT